MSLDIFLSIDNRPVYSSNITHNLTKMEQRGLTLADAATKLKIEQLTRDLKEARKKAEGAKKAHMRLAVLMGKADPSILGETHED